MKKHYGTLLFISVCLVCISFLSGVYLGRNLNGPGILINTLPADTQVTASVPIGTAATEEAPSGLLDINSATFTQLQTLPGIGPVLAQRIIDYRTKNGPFTSPADLAKVDGIGAKRLEAILDHITTGG